MITVKDIGFSSGGDFKCSLSIRGIKRVNKSFNGKKIFIVDAVIAALAQEDHFGYYLDDDMKVPLRMLLIGKIDNEGELLELLESSDGMSLFRIKREFKIDYVTQVSEDAYRYINKNMNGDDALLLLKALNDMGVYLNIYKSRSFANKYVHDSIINLLLDNTFSAYAFQNGYKHIINNEGVVYEITRPQNLMYSDEDDDNINFHLTNSVDINIPFHVLIGKNGSGKTHILCNLIKDKILGRSIRGFDETVYSRLVVISNTINDKCYRPSVITRDKSRLNNYHFISLTSEKYFNKFFPRGSKLTLLSLVERVVKRDITKEGFFRQSELLDSIIKKILPNFTFSIKTNLHTYYYNSFSELTRREGVTGFSANVDLITGVEVEYYLPDEDIVFYKDDFPFSFSSGQLSFLIGMFSIISTIENNSLVIIEEPENYLHPSLLTHFINSVTHILRDTNSIALISTHSPLVLRETPSDQITILHRSNGKTYYKKTNIETFGADTHQIMIDVFGDLYSNAIFREEVKRMANSYSIPQIIKKFSNFSSDTLNKILMEKKSK
ncbi:AAA family ATPase [Citrobacter koseri]|uniref:AAA family ATPase n=1 Tax=Citrobacter koseri TaxID=545 RepID=UPI001E4784C7|nr:AAA family ATPase [Citrobacter koseri]MDT7496280.1 AAA family ATPase [Citrobacter koseri]